MTVRELIETLEDYDEEMEVCIGMIQNYGSNFAYSVCETEAYDVNDFDKGTSEMLVLTMGRQFGKVRYE